MIKISFYEANFWAKYHNLDDNEFYSLVLSNNVCIFNAWLMLGGLVKNES